MKGWTGVKFLLSMDAKGIEDTNEFSKLRRGHRVGRNHEVHHSFSVLFTPDYSNQLPKRNINWISHMTLHILQSEGSMNVISETDGEREDKRNTDGNHVPDLSLAHDLVAITEY